MATTADIPHSIIALSRMFGWAVPGDRPSIAIAQWIEETGWGTSDAWKLGLNPFGIKDAKDARYQVTGNGPYAAYADLGDAFRDRKRILEMYRAKPGREMSSIYALLDEFWCPGTKGGTTYSQRVEAIRVQHGLAQYDDRAPANVLLEKPGTFEDMPGVFSHLADPRDAVPPGHGSGTRRPMRTGTSGLGRLIGLIAIPTAGVLLAGGGGALLARLRGLVTAIGSPTSMGQGLSSLFGLLRGEGIGSILSTVAGLLLGSGAPPVDAPEPTPLDSLEAIVRRALELVMGVVGHAEVASATGTSSPASGPVKHGIAARILAQLGVRQDVADILIPIGVEVLNGIIGHQWGDALESSQPVAPGDPPLGRRLLDLVLARWLA